MTAERDLDEVLERFEKVASNLERLDNIWKRMWEEDGGSNDDLRRSYIEIMRAIPPIDGVGLETEPMTFNEVQLARFEAEELGEPEVLFSVEDAIEAPATELADYRFRFNAQRRHLVRYRIADVVGLISEVLERMSLMEKGGTAVEETDWDSLSTRYSELIRLVGDSTPGSARWQDFARHLRFRQFHDLQDIVLRDWPSVRAEVQSSLYHELEPIPVEMTDLSELVASRPSGPVTTRLKWDALDEEGFERLVFQLLVETPGYENVTWLMKTRAADRGRDIQAERVLKDPLSGNLSLRVIIQCKHWLSRSVGLSDLIQELETVKSWEPPPVDVVIIATSGRFSQDAVARAESIANERKIPRPELWSESHLEVILAKRPHLIGSFGLR